MALEQEKFTRGGKVLRHKSLQNSTSCLQPTYLLTEFVISSRRGGFADLLHVAIIPWALGVAQESEPRQQDNSKIICFPMRVSATVSFCIVSCLSAFRHKRRLMQEQAASQPTDWLTFPGGID